MQPESLKGQNRLSITKGQRLLGKRRYQACKSLYQLTAAREFCIFDLR